MSWFNFCMLLFGISWAFVGFYRRFALDKGFVDEPNVRSSHIVVTARGGGIVFASLFFVLLGVSAYFDWVALDKLLVFAPAFLIMLIGFRDDIKSVSASVRFFCQITATIGSLYLIQAHTVEWLPTVGLPQILNLGLIALGVLWMTNLMNFMDGSDGLAAAEAVFVLGLAGVLLTWAGAYSITILCFGLASLVAGFLAWNWPKANIFMGDSGSAFLGFVIAIMALVAYRWYRFPLELWVIMTAGFWFDATVTLARRMLAGEKWTQPHCLHAYQRLIQAGWSHFAVLFGLIIVNAVLGTLTVWAYQQPRMTWMILGLALTFLTVIYLMVEIYKPMYKTWHSSTNS